MSAPDRRLSTAGESMYVILGVPPEATREEIRRAYRKMALRHHPDKNPDDPAAAERFREISRAHYILVDAPRRSFYDSYGSKGIYFAETYGEENARLYYRLSSPWFAALFFFCGLLTFFYCCCCCCCCCNFCCGRFAPDKFEEECSAEDLLEEVEGDQAPTTSQPQPTDQVWLLL